MKVNPWNSIKRKKVFFIYKTQIKHHCISCIMTFHKILFKTIITKKYGNQTKSVEKNT